ILRFVELAEQALARGATPQAIAELPVLRRIQRMGEEIGEDELPAFDGLRSALENAVAGLGAEVSHAT
ncbi:MAG TPA: hypothetical protein VEH77_17900, partial [Roseiarcus sp.]|nr:hypothetical protein [Roseiarcus sp.]